MTRKEWLPLDSRPDYPPTQAASMVQRILAGFYDLIIILSFFIFLELLLSYLPIQNTEIVSGPLFGVFLFIYCVWTVYKTGTTPGKKYFNLKVVHHLYETQPTLTTVLLRELVLKPFSFISLAYLYWKFKHHEDSICFQDHYSDTRVIVNNSENDESVKSPFPFLFSTPILVPIAIVYTLVFLATPLPLLKIKSELSSMGIQTEEINGNNIKGFKIKKISFDYKDSSLAMADMKFSLNIPELLLHQRIVINKLKIDSLNITEINKPETQSVKAQPSDFDMISSFPPSSLEIRDMSFKKFSAFGENGKHLQLFNIKLDFDRSFSVKNLIADTQFFTVDLREISYDPKENKIKINPSQFAIKSNFNSKMIKDFEFSLMSEFDLDEIEKATFNVQTPDNKVRLFQNENSFVLNINNLDIRNWIRTRSPIQSLSLNYYDNIHFSQIVKNPNIIFTQQGEVILRDRKFSLTRKTQKTSNASAPKSLTEINCEFNLCLKHKDRSFQLQFDFKNLANTKEDLKIKIDDASKNYSYKSSEDFLAQVYFNKNFSTLNDNEKAVVASDLSKLNLNPSQVADEIYLSEVRQFNKNKYSPGYLNRAGKDVLESLKQNRSALNIYKAIAYLQSVDECDSILALPSELFTDLLIQQPKLKAPIYNTLGFCAHDPSLAITLFNMSRAESASFDEETLYHMALADYKLGSPKEALLILNQLLNHRTNHKDAQILAEKLKSQMNTEKPRKPASQKRR